MALSLPPSRSPCECRDPRGSMPTRRSTRQASARVARARALPPPQRLRARPRISPRSLPACASSIGTVSSPWGNRPRPRRGPPRHRAIRSRLEVSAIQPDTSVYHVPGRAFCKPGEPLPLLFNEVTGYADSHRRTELLTWLAYLSTTHQVFVFTRDPAVATESPASWPISPRLIRGLPTHHCPAIRHGAEAHHHEATIRLTQRRSFVILIVGVAYDVPEPDAPPVHSVADLNPLCLLTQRMAPTHARAAGLLPTPRSSRSSRHTLRDPVGRPKPRLPRCCMRHHASARHAI